ncbi:hypothetical protein [Fangia hongkongensis]|uniref:hypothetical protein n=2 Tax=Fangia hongkongensis TaxID=270495 RepID=UPI0003612FE4|nr:hypothetical protein [Fangia hongkongensis]
MLLGKLRKQQGGVILIALIVVAAVAILAGSILYVVKISIVQNNAINRYNDNRNSVFLALKANISSAGFPYTNTPSSGTSNYSSANTTITVTKNVNGIYPESIMLYSPAAYLQYNSTISVTNTSGASTSYYSLINSPSQYYLIDTISPNTIQEVNIPIVKVGNLNTAQLNISSSLDNGAAGYVGYITSDNTAKTLTFTPYPATTPQSFTLNYPDNNNYVLTQGWYLSGGAWYWSLFIYDVSTNYAYQTSISLANVLDLENNDTFSTLTWTNIISPNTTTHDPYNSSIKYPKGSYVTYDGQVFVSVRAVNSGNNKDPYSKPTWWRLVIPENTYPSWNTSVYYFKGDVITENGTKYVATKNNSQSQSAPPSNRWAVVNSTSASSWQSQVYNPGEYVTYSSGGDTFTFVNIKKSNKNKTPFQQSNNWRVVNTSSANLPYSNKVYYTKGLKITYDGQTFVSTTNTKNNPYQNNQNRWRVLIPEGTAPTYNANVRYYMDDRVTFQGNVYETDRNYNQTVAPGQTPATHPGKWDLV